MNLHSVLDVIPESEPIILSRYEGEWTATVGGTEEKGPDVGEVLSEAWRVEQQRRAPTLSDVG